MKGLIIMLDFDGTMVEHKYPNMGAPVPHALDVMRRLIAKKYGIILNTMRAEFRNDTSTIAIRYLTANKIPLVAVSPRKLIPEIWPNVLGNDSGNYLYIDDTALDIPLMPTPDGTGEMVNWLQVEKDLIKLKIL